MVFANSPSLHPIDTVRSHSFLKARNPSIKNINNHLVPHSLFLHLLEHIFLDSRHGCSSRAYVVATGLWMYANINKCEADKKVRKHYTKSGKSERILHFLLCHFYVCVAAL